jgi:replication factor A1
MEKMSLIFFYLGKLRRTVLDHQPTIMSMIKKFIDPSVLPPAMAAKLNKSMIFQLRFGAFRSITNRCEVIITNIFDDSTNKSIHPLETATPEAKSSPTSKTSTPLSYMKQVLKAPSTPQNTVTQLRIAPDSLETPPQNISPNNETSINSEARCVLDFEDATQQLRQVYISPHFLYIFFSLTRAKFDGS